MEIKLPINDMSVEEIQKELITFIKEYSDGHIEGIRLKYIYALIKEFRPWYLEPSSYQMLHKRISYINGTPMPNFTDSASTPERFILDSYSCFDAPEQIKPFDVYMYQRLVEMSSRVDLIHKQQSSDDVQKYQFHRFPYKPSWGKDN